MTDINKAFLLLCQRLGRDPATSEESDTCSLRAAAMAMVAFAAVPDTARPRCSICGCRDFAPVSIRQFDQTFAPGPERRCVECKTLFTAQAFAKLTLKGGA